MNNKHRIQIITISLAVTAATALAQNGIGKPYGTCDPITCSSTKEPQRGAPSPAQAAQYFRCGPMGERVYGRNNLYLIDNVQVEIGKSRPFQGGGMSGGSDINMSDVDASQPVYPIRGSFMQWQCANPKTSISPEGQNCTLYSIPKASGVCYKTTFGDWVCRMVSDNPTIDLTQAQRRGVPGPR